MVHHNPVDRMTLISKQYLDKARKATQLEDALQIKIDDHVAAMNSIEVARVMRLYDLRDHVGKF